MLRNLRIILVSLIVVPACPLAFGQGASRDPCTAEAFQCAYDLNNIAHGPCRNGTGWCTYDSVKNCQRAIMDQCTPQIQAEQQPKAEAPARVPSMSEASISYICQIASYTQPSVITIDANKRQLMIEYYTNNTHLPCTVFYQDGNIANIFVGPNARFCGAMSDGLSHRQQVTMNNRKITATVDNPGAGTVTFDLRTAILSSDVFGASECHRTGG
jgi:hypothetical protein